MLAALILALCPSCGSPPAPETPPAKAAAPEAEAAPSGAPSAEPAASAEPAPSAAPSAKPEAAPSESAALARELVKSGGRRIGYSAAKKAFAYPVERRIQNGFSIDIQFLGEDGSPRDTLRVCQPGECEDKLDEMLKDVLPKLGDRLERDGYTAIRAIGWPSGGDELEVSSLSGKLHWGKGRLELLRQGKPAAGLGQLGKRLDGTPEAVFVVPGGKVLAAFSKPAGDGRGQVQELYLFKMP
jgi:hypothetical protein